MKKLLWVLVPLCALFFCDPGWAELSSKEKSALKSAYKTIQGKRKGPFTINTCTCKNGQLAAVGNWKNRGSFSVRLIETSSVKYLPKTVFMWGIFSQTRYFYGMKIRTIIAW